MHGGIDGQTQTLSLVSLLLRSISPNSILRSSKHSLRSVAENLLPRITNPRSALIRSFELQPTVLNHHFCREFCSGQPFEYDREVDEINLKFAEAREEIDAALESKETVYFDEEAECAREAVRSVFELFDGLLTRLPERDRSSLQRSMGLKMEQLKAELKQLDD